MNDVIKFLENPNTVKTVLSSINTKVKLPNNGFMAGGSVANMLLSLYHKGTPWLFGINDVDIFNVVDDEGTENGGEVLGLSVEDNEGYDETFIESDGTFYKVLDSTRDGLINYVPCFVEHGETGGIVRYTPPSDDIDRIMIPYTRYTEVVVNTDKDNEVIVRGFDINCCQVGIDLETSEITYTDEFVRFLKSKQVMVTLPSTPFHTLIRLLDKIDLYGDLCYCDFDTELKFMKSADSVSSSRFGGITYEKYLNHKNKDLIDNHIIITPCTYLTKGSGIGYTFKFKTIYNIVEDFESVWELKRIWELKYRVLKNSIKSKISMIWDFRYNKTLIFNGGSNSYISRFFRTNLYKNELYYDCDFTIKHLKSIADLVISHHQLSLILLNMPTVQSQYNFIKMLNKKISIHGLNIIGLIESNYSHSTIITDLWVNKLISDEEDKLSKELCVPYSVEKFKYKNCVTELNSILLLRREGGNMGHCVGGYGYKVESGKSRMFHINIKGIGSTLEVGLVRNPISNHIERFEVNQHKGRYPERGNLKPLNKNRGVAFKLVYHLSKKYLSDKDFNNVKWGKVIGIH